MEEQRICSHCGCVLGENEGTEIDDDLLCDDCAERHTVECDHCGETVWRNEAVTDDRTTLCECCYDEHYRRCEECGSIIHDNDVFWRGDYWQSSSLRKPEIHDGARRPIPFQAVPI